MKKHLLIITLAAMTGLSPLCAQTKSESANNGGISSQMLQQLQQSFGSNASDKALRNIMVNNSPAKMAVNFTA